MTVTTDRIALLELDVDMRLLDLWREMDAVEKWDLDTAAAFMRAGYGKGYCDALVEPVEGELCSTHGYKVPERQA